MSLRCFYRKNLVATKFQNAATSPVRVTITDREPGDGSKYSESLGDGQVGLVSLLETGRLLI